MTLLAIKRWRDLDRAFCLYNRKYESLDVLENQAMYVASLGVITFLKGGNERDRYEFTLSLQEFNRKLERMKKEYS